ncbi:MAG: hypothetical protein Kow00124_15100 [Anaerolineae bacterium]
MMSEDTPQSPAVSAPSTGGTGIEEYIRMITSGSVEECRQAAQKLAGAGSAAIHDLLVTLVFGPDDARQAAAWALGKVGRADAVLPLCDALHDPSERVRVTAARSLGRIGDNRARSALKQAAEQDQSPAVRRAAVDALARLRTQGASGQG